MTINPLCNFSNSQRLDSPLLPHSSNPTNEDTDTKVKNSFDDKMPLHSKEIIAQNLEKHIFHMRAPSQEKLFKDSPFGKANQETDYHAQYTTCGWVSAYLASNLCTILSQNHLLSKEEIEEKIMESAPDRFIRNSTRFVGDLSLYGGSNDKVEGLLLGEDIYSILVGSQPQGLENAFVIEGLTEEEDLDENSKKIVIFNTNKTFKTEYKETSEANPLKNAFEELLLGIKPFIIISSLETFPLGSHFVTYAFRKDSSGILESMIFEGLNEAHSEWISFDSSPPQDITRRSTMEWIYNDLIQKPIFEFTSV